jgi:hypothetical protein
MRAACDIGEGFVDRDALDERRVVAEDGDRSVPEPLVLLKVAAHENQLRTEFTRPPSRHATANAECLGLIGGSQHHSATHGDRLAAQGWVQQLLDRRIECIEIRMENCRQRLHARYRKSRVFTLMRSMCS